MVVISINKSGEVGVDHLASELNSFESEGKALVIDVDLEKAKQILEALIPDLKIPSDDLALILFYKQVYQRLSLIERKTFRTFGF